MNNILLIGIAQALFFVLLLLSKKGKALSDKILIAWLSFIALHLLVAYGDIEQWYLVFPHWAGLSFPFPLAEGPFFFLYVISLTRNPARIRWYDYLHFIPFFLVYLISWRFYFSSGPDKIYFLQNVWHIDPPISASIGRVLVLLTGPIYASYVLWKLRSHRKNIQAFFSYSDEIDLTWIRNLAIGMLLIWVVVWFVTFFNDQGKIVSFIRGDTLIYIAVSLFVFAIGYFGFRQGRIFSFNTEPDIPKHDNEQASKKYQKSGLKQQKLQTLTDKLRDFMEAEKPYLNPQLTLSELADSMQLSPHHLSQLINDGLNQNFFEFVNQHRVEAFKQAVCQEENQHLTLLAIAMDCGFNSKSSFNRIFKQLNGQTPSQFANQVLPKN